MAGLTENAVRAIRKMVAPLKRRVLLMVGRCTIQLVDDTNGTQRLQVTGLAGEVLAGVTRYQEYGFTSVPFSGANGVLLAVSGNRDNGIVVAVNDRQYRLTGLQDGEVAIHDDQDQVVHLKRDGIRIDSANNIYLRTDGVLRLEGDGVEIHGRTYVQTDVNGYGDRRTATGGVNYHDDTFKTGAVFDSATEHNLDQPHIPSDHPEGP